MTGEYDREPELNSEDLCSEIEAQLGRPLSGLESSRIQAHECLSVYLMDVRRLGDDRTNVLVYERGGLIQVGLTGGGPYFTVITDDNNWGFAFDLSAWHPPTSQIVSPPGRRMHRIVDFLFSKKVCERVLLPVLADMQEEYFEALDQKRLAKAKWVLVRGYFSLAVAVSTTTVVRVLRHLVGQASLILPSGARHDKD